MYKAKVSSHGAGEDTTESSIQRLDTFMDLVDWRGRIRCQWLSCEVLMDFVVFYSHMILENTLHQTTRRKRTPREFIHIYSEQHTLLACITHQ